MKHRFGIIKRPWGVYYSKDKQTGQQESLGTRNKAEAAELLNAKNEAHQQPMLNWAKARTYLSATDPEAMNRDWRYVMEQMMKTKAGPTKDRLARAIKDKAFESLKPLPLVETRSQHFLRVLQEGTVSTNAFLRKIHNFALDMNWLMGPVIPKRAWPKVVHKQQRGITRDEHERIIAREPNDERRAYYQLCWYLGGSQTDMARLCAENINGSEKVIVYNRVKNGKLCKIRFGVDAEAVLLTRPRHGLLFPYLASVRECDRATEFKQRCRGLGIAGVSLHSYRYGWAERAMECGFAERYAQAALGHGSKAVHRAYAKKADVTIPALEDAEKEHAEQKLIRVAFQAAPGMTGDISVPELAGRTI